MRTERCRAKTAYASPLLSLVPGKGAPQDLCEHQDLLREGGAHRRHSVAVREFHAIPGHGPEATVDDRLVLVWNRKLTKDRGIELDDPGDKAADLKGDGHTVVCAAVDGETSCLIAIADTIRSSARRTVEGLHELGMQVAMRTGDSRATAERVASELGIHPVFAEALPGVRRTRVGTGVSAPSPSSG